MYSHALQRRSIPPHRLAIAGDPGGSAPGELGFDGVVITDSLEADAVLAAHRSRCSGAVARGGADLLLMTGRGSWIHVFQYLLRRARISPALRAGSPSRLPESEDVAPVLLH